jgi:uncharacterized protein (DUF58 family)
MENISLNIFDKIRKIQYATTQLANEIMAGAWHSAFKGQGIEFEEVREYQSGDDIRLIHWQVTARMDRPYLKVFREERELTVFLIVDISASLQFGSKNLKRNVVAEISAVLAFSAIKNNDRIGLVLFSNRVEKYVPPKKGTRHVLRIIRELVAFEPKYSGTDIACALSFVNSLQRKASICFLISDFICPDFSHELALTARRHDLIAINVVDPYEIEFPATGMVNFSDLESETFQVIDTSNQKNRRHFKKKELERIENTKTLIEKAGAGFLNIYTDQPYLESIHKFFKLRQRRR